MKIKLCILILLSIILPSLAYLIIYLLAKSNICVPNCQNKKCGDPDGCKEVCQKCNSGLICGGTTNHKCIKEINGTSPSGKIGSPPESKEKYVGDLSRIYNTPVQTPSHEEKTRGIVYFDIDGTLTHSRGDQEQIIQHCLDKGFGVGIATASTRLPKDMCIGDKSRVKWMPNKLCKYMSETNFRTFNSILRTGGKDSYYNPKQVHPGWAKGEQMIRNRNMYFPHIPDKNLILFDNDPGVLSELSRTHPNIEMECANIECGNTFLSPKLVHDKLSNY